jgi:hypothetical protein
VTLQRAAVDHLDRAAELARRVPAIARDHQHATHPRLAAQAGEKAIERLAACEVAHRQMRHRFESGRAQAYRSLDRLLGRPGRHRADIDASAGGRDAGQGRHLLGRRPRRFEREPAHEIGDRADRVDAVGGLDAGHGGRPGHRGHSRRREIT